MDEIEASIPPVPSKPTDSGSGPIVFDDPIIPAPGSDKVSAPPPLVFQPEAEQPKSTSTFTPTPKKDAWKPANAAPAAAPSIFPNAKPTAGPTGFQAKTETPGPEKTPFTGETGLTQVSSTKAIDNLLGALHSKPHTPSSGTPIFGGSSSSFKKTS